MDEELVAPGIEGLKGLGAVDIVHEDAAVCAAVEGHAERLEALLAGGIPELEGDDAIVDGYFFGEEVGAYRCFVRGAEFLVDLGGMLDRVGLPTEWRCSTYWFIKLVLPTPLSPRMITCTRQFAALVRQSHSGRAFNRTFFLDAISGCCAEALQRDGDGAVSADAEQLNYSGTVWEISIDELDASPAANNLLTLCGSSKVRQR